MSVFTPTPTKASFSENEPKSEAYLEKDQDYNSLNLEDHQQQRQLWLKQLDAKHNQLASKIETQKSALKSLQDNLLCGNIDFSSCEKRLSSLNKRLSSQSQELFELKDRCRQSQSGLSLPAFDSLIQPKKLPEPCQPKKSKGLKRTYSGISKSPAFFPAKRELCPRSQKSRGGEGAGVGMKAARKLLPLLTFLPPNSSVHQVVSASSSLQPQPVLTTQNEPYLEGFPTPDLTSSSANGYLSECHKYYPQVTQSMGFSDPSLPCPSTSAESAKSIQWADPSCGFFSNAYSLGPQPHPQSHPQEIGARDNLDWTDQIPSDQFSFFSVDA